MLCFIYSAPVLPKPSIRPASDGNLPAITDGRESSSSGSSHGEFYNTSNNMGNGRSGRRQGSLPFMRNETRGRQSLPVMRSDPVYGKTKPPPNSRFKPEVPPPNWAPLPFQTRFDVRKWQPERRSAGQREEDLDLMSDPPPRQGKLYRMLHIAYFLLH